MNGSNGEFPSVFLREFPRDRFVLRKSDDGLLLITRSREPDKCLRLDCIAGRQQLTDILTPIELNRLDSGCIIEVWSEEIRVVVFEELWEKRPTVEDVRTSNRMEALL